VATVLPDPASKRLLLSCLLLSCPPVFAQATDFKTLCEEQLPAPSLQVKRAESGHSIDRHLSYRELTGMGAGLLRHGKQNVLGITRAETSTTVEVKMARLEHKESGQECVSPQVVVNILYKPIEVFIGREFPPDTCAYREILLHEMRHVHAYQDHLPQVQAALRIKLGRLFSDRIIYGQPGGPEEKLKADIHKRWLPVVDNEIRKVDAAQAEIDSAAEYNRMEKVCDGEVQRLMEPGD